jgi:EmrB/QacA subfamily drug resistance transporter
MAAESISSVKAPRRLSGFVLFSVLTALLLTLFLEALDNTIVGPVMPNIINEFAGIDRYSWVATAYLLTSTIAIPVVGKLSDQFGRKWFLLSGASIFLLGSLLCGAAQNMGQLIGFRALQGLGAGAGITLVPTVIGDIFPPEERAKWQASVSLVYTLANLLGPGLGGWITDHGPLLAPLITDTTRWRWIFYLNLPLGVIALTTLLVLLPTNLSLRSLHLTDKGVLRRIDVTGALLSMVTTICLLLGLTWGSNQTYDWISPQVGGILLASMVSSLLFVLVERRALEPILPLHLFRNQIFAADSLLALLVYMILVGLGIYLPLLLQTTLAASATSAGVSLIPFLLSITGGATLSGWLISRFKRNQIILLPGTLIMAGGVFFLTRITPTTGLLTVVSFMIVVGLGIGSIFSVLYPVAQNVLLPTQLGVGSAVIRYLGQIGATLGVAIVGAVVNQSLTNPASNTQEALTHALQQGFLALLVCCILAFLAACFLKDLPEKQSSRKISQVLTNQETENGAPM